MSYMPGLRYSGTTMKRKILVLGGGGHSRCIQESLLEAGYEPDEIGIVDPCKDICSLPGIQWIGKDDDLVALRKAGWNNAVIGVGSIETTALRRKLTAIVSDAGIEIITITDKYATVSKNSEVGLGVFIAKRAVIQPGVNIRAMAIINTGAIIEHDCKIGEFSHISPGCVLLGEVTVGNDTLIGGGSVVRQGIHVGNNCVVGAGSVVVNDIPDNSVAYGNPCKVWRQKS